MCIHIIYVYNHNDCTNLHSHFTVISPISPHLQHFIIFPGFMIAVTLIGVVLICHFIIIVMLRVFSSVN